VEQNIVATAYHATQGHCVHETEISGVEMYMYYGEYIVFDIMCSNDNEFLM
jgi:hypothetical protein